MKVYWAPEGRAARNKLSWELAEAVESEVDTRFTDAIPASAHQSPDRPVGILTLTLPCGLNIDFDRTGDGVLILNVSS